jgi:N4-gp56 family major capsid protein
MAGTDYPVNHPQARKYWSSDLFKESLKKTYAFRFMGTGSNSLCQVRNELKDDGDMVRVNLRLQLAGAGVQGDAVLEGNEEALTIYHDDVYIDQLRHAVKSGGKMSEQRVPYSVRSEARDGLGDWWADRFDYAFFNQLSGNTNEADTRYTGLQAAIAPQEVILDATSTASLSTADVFSIKYIDWAIEKAKTRAYPIRPVRVGGKDYYVLFVHEYQATDLRRNYTAGEWGDLQRALLEGGQGADANGIFAGALGVYNNTIIHSTSRLPTTGTATHRRAVFCGAQAAAIAFGKGFSSGSKFAWTESYFDYENQLGVGTKSIFGLKKLQYNSTDFGTIVIPTYAVAHE